MKTPNTRKSNITKKLKFDPNKNNKQRLWNIEKIRNERINLKIQKEQNKSCKKSIINYVQQKEYEIAWQQNCPKGLWPDTWEPQENIPDFTRLDYLLRKKSQLRISKKKGRQQRMKSKESFKQHLQFTMKNIRTKYQTITPLNIRKQNVKKILDRNQKQRSLKKEQKTQNYKDWYLSYSSKMQGFQILVQRMLRGEKNIQNEELQKQGKNKAVKLPFFKQEFLNSFSAEQKQTISLKTEQSLKRSKDHSQQQKLVSYHHHSSSHYVLPEKSTNIFIKNIEYIGNENFVDYFRLELFDNSISYISEQDLVKYFPYAYQKFMVKTICQSIDDAIKSMSAINYKQDFVQRKCVKNLGQKIGLYQQDFQLTNQTSNLLFPKRTKSGFDDMSDIFGNRPYSIKSDQEKPEQNQSQRLDSLQQGPQKTKKGIQNYFNYIKRCDGSPVQIMQQQIVINQQENLFNKKSEQIISFQSTRCKELFKNYEMKQTKESFKQKDSRMTILPKVSNISNNENIVQKSPQKIINIQSNPINTGKISTQSGKIVIKKADIHSKIKETIEIKNNQKITKKSNLESSRILSQDKQIYEILNVMQKTQKQQDDFYDSDDQRN